MKYRRNTKNLFSNIFAEGLQHWVQNALMFNKQRCGKFLRCLAAVGLMKPAIRDGTAKRIWVRHMKPILQLKIEYRMPPAAARREPATTALQQQHDERCSAMCRKTLTDCTSILLLKQWHGWHRCKSASTVLRATRTSPTQGSRMQSRLRR